MNFAKMLSGPTEEEFTYEGRTYVVKGYSLTGRNAQKERIREEVRLAKREQEFTVVNGQTVKRDAPLRTRAEIQKKILENLRNFGVSFEQLNKTFSASKRILGRHIEELAKDRSINLKVYGKKQLEGPLSGNKIVTSGKIHRDELLYGKILTTGEKIVTTKKEHRELATMIGPIGPAHLVDINGKVSSSISVPALENPGFSDDAWSFITEEINNGYKRLEVNYNYIAQDKNGKVFAYKEKPSSHIMNNHWFSKDGSADFMMMVTPPKDWKLAILKLP